MNIAVSGEQDLTMRVKIDNSGSIDYPYIGSLLMKGKTPEQVSNEIADKLRGNYLQAPMVPWLAVSQTALTVTIFKFDRPAAVSCWKMSPPTPPCRLEIPLLLA